MKKYLVLEIGKSAYTEFKMKNGNYEKTEDAILIDEIEATSKEEAVNIILKNNKNRVFDKLVAREVID